MTDITEIKSLVETSNRTIEALRTDVKADADKVVRMEADLAQSLQAKQDAELKLKAIEERLQKMETKANRPNFGGAAEKTSDLEVKAALVDFVKTGSREAADLLSKADGVNITNAPDGGVAVPQVLESQILTLAKNMSPLRSIAREMVLANEDWRQVVELGEVGATWTDELSDREDDETPDLGQIGLSFGEMKAHVWTTHKALHDTIINVEPWLIDGISKKFARAEGLAFVSGNGTNQPKGFLAGPAPVATADETRAFGTLQYFATGAAGDLGSAPFDTLYRAFYGLKGAYRANASLVMNSAVMSVYARVKDANGQYMLNPAVSAGAKDKLLNYEVTFAEDMPNIAANAFSVAFGDFKAGYGIADIAGMYLVRDPYSKAPKIYFKASRRVGGGLLDTQAIKLIKIAAS